MSNNQLSFSQSQSKSFQKSKKKPYQIQNKTNNLNYYSLYSPFKKKLKNNSLIQSDSAILSSLKSSRCSQKQKSLKSSYHSTRNEQLIQKQQNEDSEQNEAQQQVQFSNIIQQFSPSKQPTNRDEIYIDQEQQQNYDQFTFRQLNKQQGQTVVTNAYINEDNILIKNMFPTNKRIKNGPQLTCLKESDKARSRRNSNDSSSLYPKNYQDEFQIHSRSGDQILIFDNDNNNDNQYQLHSNRSNNQQIRHLAIGNQKQIIQLAQSIGSFRKQIDQQKMHIRQVVSQNISFSIDSDLSMIQQKWNTYFDQQSNQDIKITSSVNIKQNQVQQIQQIKSEIYYKSEANSDDEEMELPSFSTPNTSLNKNQLIDSQRSKNLQTDNYSEVQSSNGEQHFHQEKQFKRQFTFGSQLNKINDQFLSKHYISSDQKIKKIPLFKKIVSATILQGFITQNRNKKNFKQKISNKNKFTSPSVKASINIKQQNKINIKSKSPVNTQNKQMKISSKIQQTFQFLKLSNFSSVKQYEQAKKQQNWQKTLKNIYQKKKLQNQKQKQIKIQKNNSINQYNKKLTKSQENSILIQQLDDQFEFLSTQYIQQQQNKQVQAVKTIRFNISHVNNDDLNQITQYQDQFHKQILRSQQILYNTSNIQQNLVQQVQKHLILQKNYTNHDKQSSTTAYQDHLQYQKKQSHEKQKKQLQVQNLKKYLKNLQLLAIEKNNKTKANLYNYPNYRFKQQQEDKILIKNQPKQQKQYILNQQSKIQQYKQKYDQKYKEKKRKTYQQQQKQTYQAQQQPTYVQQQLQTYQQQYNQYDQEQHKNQYSNSQYEEDQQQFIIPLRVSQQSAILIDDNQQQSQQDIGHKPQYSPVQQKCNNSNKKQIQLIVKKHQPESDVSHCHSILLLQKLIPTLPTKILPTFQKIYSQVYQNQLKYEQKQKRQQFLINFMKDMIECSKNKIDSQQYLVSNNNKNSIQVGYNNKNTIQTQQQMQIRTNHFVISSLVRRIAQKHNN